MAITVNTKTTVKPTKWEKTYENEESITIWKYDSNITTHGPIEVEIKYKKSYVHPLDKKKKTIGDLAKEARKETKSKKSKL